MDVSDGEMLDLAIDDYRREKARAEKAEARVKELEAQVEREAALGMEYATRVESLEAKLAAAEEVCEAFVPLCNWWYVRGYEEPLDHISRGCKALAAWRATKEGRTT